MKAFYVRIGLICDFEDVSVGHNAAISCVLMGVLVFILALSAS